MGWPFLLCRALSTGKTPTTSTQTNRSGGNYTKNTVYVYMYIHVEALTNLKHAITYSNKFIVETLYFEVCFGLLRMHVLNILVFRFLTITDERLLSNSIKKEENRCHQICIIWIVIIILMRIYIIIFFPPWVLVETFSQGICNRCRMLTGTLDPFRSPGPIPVVL